MNIKNNSTTLSCQTGLLTKQCKAPSNGHLIKTSHDINAHVDICGPISLQAEGGKPYFPIMTTTPHRYTESTVLSHYTVAIDHFLKFIV